MLEVLFQFFVEEIFNCCHVTYKLVENLEKYTFYSVMVAVNIGGKQGCWLILPLLSIFVFDKILYNLIFGMIKSSNLENPVLLKKCISSNIL